MAVDLGTLAPSPTATTRVLGAAGIVGGAVLLAAYLIEIPSGLNDVRLILFTIGAIAVVAAVHMRQVTRAPRLSLAVGTAAILANASTLSMVVLARAQDHPFGGDFGLAYFYIVLAMWLADAAFGFVTLRLGVATRWGAGALVIGSLLAILGMDRLGLTSASDITVFGRLGLIGAALSGIGWVLLGLDLVVHRQRGEPIASR